MRALLATGLRVFCLMVCLTQMGQAQPCRLALVLALDVSGSVDPVEYAQQIDGLAAALDDSEVRAAILSEGVAPVSLTVFEWSSRNHQIIIQPWVALETSAALDGVIARIRAHRKKRAGLKTALGTALSFAAAQFAHQAQCWAKTIDVSGDGKNNIGPTPAQMYQAAVFDGITVNALVIGDPSGSQTADDQSLLAYYETDVIHGPAAFAMIAQGYQDYAHAMRRKLLRELALPVLGRFDF